MHAKGADVMTLKPQDIQSKQFHVRLRGFDVDEVDVFLEQIAEDFLTLIQENKQLKERLQELTKEIDDYRRQEKEFQHAILSAQKIADEMKEKSRREADDLLAESSNEAQRLLDAAHTEAAGLQQQIDELKNVKIKARDEVQQILNKYLGRLNEVFEESPAGADEQTEDEFPVEAVSDTESEIEEEITAGADDLSDLYEKIDLPDGVPATEENAEVQTDQVGPVDSMIEDGQEPPPSTLPDLDEDISFSLEDPLDDIEPDVPIAGEEDKPEKE